MSQLEKLIRAFSSCDGPFPFDKFERMLKALGYVELAKGKTGGSRRRFAHPDTQHVVIFHEPHNGELGPGTVKAIRNDLTDKGIIDAS